MCHFPHRSAPRPSRGPPTSKQVDNPPEHHPRHPETTEESTPQSRSHVAVKKKMVHGLPSLLAHIASVYHYNMSLPKVVQGKDIAKGCGPHTKGSP
jgi:hypothetical protein